MYNYTSTSLAIMSIEIHLHKCYNIITVKGTEARLENELAGSSEAINKRRGWRANRQRIP